MNSVNIGNIQVQIQPAENSAGEEIYQGRFEINGVQYEVYVNVYPVLSSSSARELAEMSITSLSL